VTCDQFAASTCRLSTNAVQVLHDIVGDPGINAQQLERVWSGLRAKLSQLRSLETAFQEITEACAAVARAGARDWSKRLLSEPVTGDGDPVVPSDWKAAWNWAAQLTYLERIGAASDLATLQRERLAIEKDLRDAFARENLARQFATKVRERIEAREIRHLSVFALAPQPLLIELGRLLCDIAPADVHQLHREPKGWRWPADGAAIRFRGREPQRMGGPVALVFALSAAITDDRITDVLGADVTLRSGRSRLRARTTIS
jgi:hypothetical protein